MNTDDADLLEKADDEEKNSTCSETGYYKYIPTPIELFFKAKRPEFKRLYPNIGNRDRRKKMRLAWKNASDEEKEHYIAERNRLKEEAYGSETANEEKVTKKVPILQVGRSKKRNEELTAGFFIFVEEHRQKNLKHFNKLHSLKIGYELKQQWGEMVPSDGQNVTFANVSKLVWPMRTRNDQRDIREDGLSESIQSLLTKEKYVEISQACEEKAAKFI
ncbi:hypothetical protein CRE_13599 [Caenorhabditis remanei]|uniref:HMG box domain-containing protein n=1 Tax=Caenorhabditis remanei TaxID=31234 RepID=E3N1G0_CAERE|nr:hypothetical protein CRE_13599 [Caenorhabditis remanei]